MSEFKEGQKVYLVSFDIDRRPITGIDIIDGIPKYWIGGHLGYFSKHDLFNSKNEAIDYMIAALEARKDG